jgi:PEP-CTERM motif
MEALMKKRGARGRRKKANALTKTLVATALVTGAAGTVEAVDESSFGGDFADVFGSADALDVGTTEVTGVSDPFPVADFFKFSGLDPDESFTLSVERTGGQSFTNVSVLSLLDSGATPLDGPTSLNTSSSPVSLTGTIPADGILIFEASGGEAINYRVTLSAPLSAPVPEPSTIALTALGAALSGVFARRRRKARGTQVS